MQPISSRIWSRVAVYISRDDNRYTTGTSYNSYFFSSSATIVCSRYTFRARSHYLPSVAGNPFCEVVRRPENTHEEQTGLLEWPAGLSLRLRDQRTTPLRLSDHLISAFSPKLQTLYCLFFFSPMQIYEYPLHLRIFLFMADYRNLHTSGIGTYILPGFFGNLLILSADGNICHSIHRQ